MRRFSSLITLAAAAALLGGCVFGPHTLRRSRVRYNQAIQRTQDEQLLLNLVRLRYCDTPQFLEVSSVSSQFVFDGSGDISNTFINARGWDSLRFGFDAGYTEKPTINFQPLQGEDFVQRLFTPIPLDRVISLQRSGWSIERVLRLCVQDMNGLANAPTASGPTPALAPDHEEFERATALLRALQLQGMIQIGYLEGSRALSEGIAAEAVTPSDLIEAAREGYRFTSDGEAMTLMGSSRSLRLVFADEAREQPEARELTELLRLGSLLSMDERLTEPAQVQLLAAGGWQPSTLRIEQPPRLALSTRSLMGALFYLSHAVEVPAEHVERGMVTVTRDEAGAPFDWSEVTGDLLRIHSSVWPPLRATIAVQHRGHWFYIEDSDLSSKATFALLSQLFALQAGEAQGEVPVLTLPVG
jgi:hypothetical protein